MSQDFGENKSIKNIKSEKKNQNISQEFRENNYIKIIKSDKKTKIYHNTLEKIST